MKVGVHSLISVAIFIIFYTGFQGGRYFLANRLQELGLLCALILFFYGALLTSLNIKEKDLRWSWWVFSTVIFVAYTFILPAYLFSNNAHVAMVPSVFASREFLVVLICPALYFLYRLGYDVKLMERIFLNCLVSLVLSYVFHYFRMDLKAAYFSTDHTQSGLITYDLWRGFRLKTPSFAFYLVSVLAPMMMFKSEKTTNKILWVLMVLLLLWVWVLVSQRSMALSLIVAAVGYHFALARKERLGFLYLILPAALIGIWIGVGEAFDALSKLDPDNEGVRFKSYMISWGSIQDHPLFGFGQQSNSTLTEQEIFWYKFFSADLGIIGTTFKYGFVGAMVYIGYTYFLAVRLVKTNWLYMKMYGEINPTIFSLLVVHLGFTVNIALTPVYTYIPGLTAAAFSIALTSIWKHKMKLEYRNRISGAKLVS